MSALLDAQPAHSGLPLRSGSESADTPPTTLLSAPCRQTAGLVDEYAAAGRPCTAPYVTDPYVTDPSFADPSFTDPTFPPGGPGPGDGADERVYGQAAEAETSNCPGGSTSRTEQVRRLTNALFARLVELDPGTAEHDDVREQLIRHNLPMVRYVANRFRHRSEPHDDIVQVGTIGLIKAIDRFDPHRGVPFAGYAMPTIIGEVKRHFRDSGWSLRVPRRVQELWLSLSDAIETLSQAYDRRPTVAEMAAYLQVTPEEVVACLEATNAYSAASLDAPDNSERGLADSIGYHDRALEGVEYRESLRPLLIALPPRERRILMLRFFANQTQSQIAAELGISQMHVSRLLTRTLTRLREALTAD